MRCYSRAMRRVTNFLGIVLGSVLWITCSVVLLSRVMHPPGVLVVGGVDICELPCWAGITPGVTSFEAVQGVLEANVGGLHRMVASGSQIHFTAIDDAGAVGGVVTYTDGKVRGLNLDGVTESVGVLINALGQPDCAWASSVYTYLDPLPFILYWEREGSFITVLVPLFATERLTPRQRSQVLTVNYSESAICEDRALTPWRGFAPPQFYSGPNS